MKISRMIVVSVVLVLGILVHRGWSQEGGGGGEESQEQQKAPKNISLNEFKGKTRKEVIVVMKVWGQALGVKCSHCHVKDFSSDEKQEKKTAREMATMLAEMNEKYQMLDKKGSCYMCHRGAKEPVLKPDAPPPGQ